MEGYRAAISQKLALILSKAADDEDERVIKLWKRYLSAKQLSGFGVDVVMKFQNYAGEVAIVY